MWWTAFLVALLIVLGQVLEAFKDGYGDWEAIKKSLRRRLLGIHDDPEDEGKK
ncbi:MAG: hypothetical protein HPY57_09085 [Ignavibacteria bacterium]|nr:hypothetical protein [Ignavibacteria bacterium]